ncbi:hypothetical protein SAMN05444141_11323 [Pseudovibrio denitrificans]|uniref:Uncharacterized protein n=1 Tax=Pseudovibrio denitrificans TaxID=258256 RepID=A0A1I7DYL1_9HYPH|nr:hypothetical protein [Pseudovibrio denitrificans]SFU16768.1 hypothetical protein SAMN05444141_11323 [Pseudovibrio denitrificans]
MYNFTRPTCAATAIIYLVELHQADLLFHADDSPQECIFGREIPSATLEVMDQFMQKTHVYLEDPHVIIHELSKSSSSN